MSITLQEREQVHQQLSQWIDDDPRRLQVFVDLVLAIPLSRSLQSGDLAANIIRDIQDQSIAQMLRRFFQNKAISWEQFYLPLLNPLLNQLELEVYYLAIDTTDVGQDHRAVVLSLTYHQRSIPLIWHIQAGSKGHTTEQLQVELLQKLYAHFQPDKPVIFLGDSEFDGITVQQQLNRQGWYYVCRTSPTQYIYPEGQTGFPIGNLVPQSGLPAQQLDQITFTTKHQYGPLSCFACWEEPHLAPLLLVYHLPPGWNPRQTYQRRFWTEPLFSDCKEGGFRLNTSRLNQADRLNRLFLAVAAAYLWMICLGVQVIAQELADWVDRSSRRTLSVFKTGWRWFKRQTKLGRPVPFDLFLPSHFDLPELKFF